MMFYGDVLLVRTGLKRSDSLSLGNTTFYFYLLLYLPYLPLLTTLLGNTTLLASCYNSNNSNYSNSSNSVSDSNSDSIIIVTAIVTEIATWQWP